MSGTFYAEFMGHHRFFFSSGSNYQDKRFVSLMCSLQNFLGLALMITWS